MHIATKQPPTIILSTNLTVISPISVARFSRKNTYQTLPLFAVVTPNQRKETEHHKFLLMKT